jgi:DNA-binding NtrC family response regulator
VLNNLSQQPLPAAAPQQLGVVLVVDDQPSVRLVLGRLLALNGCTARHATCLQEVQTVTERDRIDACLIDLTLAEGESGLDVLAWLRTQPKHRTTPILMFTGLAAVSQAQEEMIRRGNASVVYKTDTLRLAVESVKKLLVNRSGKSK